MAPYLGSERAKRKGANVVPAKAGIHNHRFLLLHQMLALGAGAGYPVSKLLASLAGAFSLSR
jgi:hypothetical protein